VYDQFALAKWAHADQVAGRLTPMEFSAGIPESFGVFRRLKKVLCLARGIGRV
jgi:hypothetical protein